MPCLKEFSSKLSNIIRTAHNTRFVLQANFNFLNASFFPQIGKETRSLKSFEN